jgi:L-fuculose-phosphate aldolase
MLITPTAIPCDRLQETDLVEMGLESEPPSGSRPSSEWRLHADIYRQRPDAGAVLHAHPPFSTALACLREDLPAVHYMIAITGSERVRCSEYALFGTSQLSAAALAALGDSKACLLANHGLVTLGRDLSEALRIAVELETVAEYWWRARAVGKPVILTRAEMADAIARFSSYR